MPEPAGIKFQCFGCELMPSSLFRFIPVACASLGLRQRSGLTNVTVQKFFTCAGVAGGPLDPEIIGRNSTQRP